MKNAYAEIKIANKPLVDSLLAINTKNRNLRPGVVDRYMRDISSGKWVLTNQGIGVSKNGVLIDGQHRLHAIKKSGYPPVPLLIVYGLDENAQLAVDQQSKRSARDCLQFAFGVRVSRSAPAVASVILRSERSNFMVSPTISEVMDSVADNMDAIEYVVSVPANASFFAAAYLAAFVVAIKQGANKERVADFMRQVESGEMLEKTMPAFHLRNLIIHSKSASGGSLIQLERFQKTTKAINAYLNGEKMGVLRA